MAAWLLVVSRDPDLAKAVARARFHTSSHHHLWAVEGEKRARECISSRTKMPSVIVLDDLFVREEPLVSVAAEFSRLAPVIVITATAARTGFAPLVAAGSVDIVARDEPYIPLTAALVERALRREQEAQKESWHSKSKVSPYPIAGRPASQDRCQSHGAPQAALQLVGIILDHLEPVFTERCRLTPLAARRLDRTIDLVFELRHNLRTVSDPADNSEFLGCV